MNQAPKRRGRPPKLPKLHEDLNNYYLENPDELKRDIERFVQPSEPVQKPILEEAHEIIFGDRESTYGDPGKNLRIIASMWSAYLDKEVTYQDVCNMMVLMKVARLKNTPNHRDSLVDIAGYTALQDRVNRA